MVENGHGCTLQFLRRRSRLDIGIGVSHFGLLFGSGAKAFQSSNTAAWPRSPASEALVAPLG